MYLWTLAKGQSKIHLEPPLLHLGKVTGESVGSTAPRPPFPRLYSRQTGPILGPSVPANSCLRHRLSRPLPASERTFPETHPRLARWGRVPQAS